MRNVLGLARGSEAINSPDDHARPIGHPVTGRVPADEPPTGAPEVVRGTYSRVSRETRPMKILARGVLRDNSDLLATVTATPVANRHEAIHAPGAARDIQHWGAAGGAQNRPLWSGHRDDRLHAEREQIDGYSRGSGDRTNAQIERSERQRPRPVRSPRTAPRGVPTAGVGG